jgi:hypothetical protein
MQGYVEHSENEFLILLCEGALELRMRRVS